MNRFLPLFLIPVLLLFACKSMHVITFNPPASPGFEMYYRHTTNTESEMKMLGQIQTSVKTETFEYSYRLDSIATGRTTFWTIRPLRMMTDQNASDGHSSHFDTADITDDDGIGKTIWNRLSQADIRLMVDSTGKTLSVNGLTALFDSIEHDFISLPNSGKMINGFRQVLADSTILEMTRELWGCYPKQAVQKKQSWLKVTYSGPNQCLQRETSYTLRDASPGKATLATTMRIIPVPGKTWEVDFGNLKIRYDLVTQSVGRIHLTRPDGLLATSDMQVEQTGTFYMKGDQFPVTRSVEVRNKTLEKIERIK